MPLILRPCTELHFMLGLLSQVLSNRALVKVWHKLLGEAHLLYCVKQRHEGLVELELPLEFEHAILSLFGTACSMQE